MRRDQLSRNSGCEFKIPIKEIHEHEDLVCGYKTSEICKKGCGLLLLEGSVESHECLPALHQKVAEQRQIIATLEEDIENLSNKFEVRENSLIQRIAMLTRKLQVQSMQFQNQLRNCQTQLDQILAVKNNNNSCDSKCGQDKSVTLMLERIHVSGSLGFNIMGGYSSENNNNNNTKQGMVTEGIIVSRVLTGGPADLKGLKTHDQVVKVSDI